MTSRAAMRRAMRKAGFGGTAAFTVYNALCGLADRDPGIIPDARQPTFRKLQDLCGGISSRTVDRAAKHLERHGWVTRHQVTGYARRTFYTLQIGAPCDCRPGRGAPMTDAVRAFNYRARKRAVTLGESTIVTARESTIVTLSGSTNQASVTFPERDDAQVRGAKPIEVTDLSLEQTEVRPALGLTSSTDNGQSEAPATAELHEGDRRNLSPLSVRLVEGPAVTDGQGSVTSVAHVFQADVEVTPSDAEPFPWPLMQTGPCVKCRQPAHRYGQGATLYCPACLAGQSGERWAV